MKKFLFIVGSIILAGGIFIGGLLAGTQLDFMTKLLQVSMFEEALSKATVTFMQLSQLEDGKINDAKNLMNSQLDCQILVIGTSLKDYPNQETKKQAENLLLRIAKQRMQHPVPAEKDMTKAGDYIQEILGRAIANEKTIEPLK
jgi:hypothetical protein